MIKLAENLETPDKPVSSFEKRDSTVPARVEPLGRNGTEGMLRILIGICSCLHYAHKHQAVRDTWLRVLAPGITALFFTGESKEINKPGLVQLACPDDYGHLPSKVQSFYSYALVHHDFDYLFKCDDDTYVHPERLLGLPRPGVEFIGNPRLFSHGWTNGGAGYLMSREMTKRFAARPVEAKGAEDVVFSNLAKASGLKIEMSSELHEKSDKPPEHNNETITAHWCDPIWMRCIHGELFGDPPGPLLLKLRAKHPAWSGFVRLYADGSFFGGGGSPHGKWEAVQGGNFLILRWHHWPSDTLQRQAWGFEESKLRLEFLDVQGPV